MYERIFNSAVAVWTTSVASHLGNQFPDLVASARSADEEMVPRLR